MEDGWLVVCPYCCEEVEIALDPMSTGVLVQDCEVCCHPWELFIARDEEGQLSVEVRRAQ